MSIKIWDSTALPVTHTVPYMGDSLLDMKQWRQFQPASM